MFGRLARLPVDINFAKYSDPKEKLDKFMKAAEPQESNEEIFNF